MSDTRRVIETYFDVSRSKETDSNGNAQGEARRMTLFRGTQALVRAHMQITAAQTASFPAGVTWTFCIDNSYVTGDNDLVITQDAGFNVASDWTGTGGINLDEGRISFQIDTATDRLTTAFVDAGNPPILSGTVGEIWMHVPGASSILQCQFPITMKNIVCDVDQDTELESISTTIIRHVGDSIELYYPDGSLAQKWTP